MLLKGPTPVVDATSSDVGDGTSVDASGPRPPTDQLVEAYNELAGLLVQGPDVIGLLERVAELAVEVMDFVDACGITLQRGREVSTIAGDGTVAMRADELQYGAGQGPCLQAMREGKLVHVPNLLEETRWPVYRDHALQEGIRSSLSVPLMVQGASTGAINMYGLQPHRFSPAQVNQARLFAGQVAITLTVVLTQASKTEISEQMQRALLSRAVIDQAMGVVMATRRCSAAEAFAALRELSQRSNRRMADVAATLITTTTGHPPQPPRPFVDRS